MALDREFGAGTLAGLRAAVRAEVAEAGMPGERAADVVIAVHELAANVVQHGGGGGVASVHAVADQLYCQVTDPGPVGGDGSWPVEPGHGLWLVHALADRVRVACGRGGSRVTAMFTLPGPGE